MIDFYGANTPNGQKVAIALEEFGLPYTLHRVDLGKDEQKSPEFLKINPNGKIPAIVDRENHAFAVFESGAILIYLADHTRRFLPELGRDRSVAIQWLMFQMGGIGPMAGQAGYFVKRAPEKLPHAIDRYQGEVRRLFGVMDGRLAEAKFLSGDDYTIADMATWPWVAAHPFYEVPLDGLPHLKRWVDLVGARPAVQKGMAVLKS